MKATRSAPTPGRAAGRLSEAGLRRARLLSGLVLMAFTALHLVNHALLLVSLPVAEAARPVFLFVWRNPVGTLVLYGAAAVHLSLVLLALYRRRTLVMPPREALQVGLGLLIPVLLAEHVVGTRVYESLTGIHVTYAFVLNALWVATPATGARQAIALVVIWTHGCLGIYFWIRFRAWYPQWAPWLLIAAVLVPVLALLGFAEGGRTVAALPPFEPSPPVAPEVIEAGLLAKQRLVRVIYIVFLALLALVLAARILRMWRERRNLLEIRYSSGEVVRIARGHSVLEASRIGGIPHYAVCGGRGRCSTCRIKVSDGLDRQPSPGAIEQATLARIGAEPDVRLACQLHPVTNVGVTPLLMPEGRRAAAALAAQPATPGREQEVAILFCDIRGFTAIADHRLPFDIVFLLNRYFAVIGKAVEQAGGRLDKFIGDGAMALFGVGTTNVEACRQAIAAAAAILVDLDRLSGELKEEISTPLKVAVGIHAGPAIVGAMGYRSVMGVTAIGDTVNVASRLEAVAKEFDAAVVISEVAALLSGFDLSAYEMRNVEIRGRADPLHVRVVPQGARLDVKPRSHAASAAE